MKYQMKYQKKPAMVEAIQWDGENFEPLWELAHIPKGLNCGQRLSYAERGAGGTIWQPFTPNSSGRVMIHTSKGAMSASPGDWIIRDAEGEFYPVKDEMFQATYEPVEEEK